MPDVRIAEGSGVGIQLGFFQLVLTPAIVATIVVAEQTFTMAAGMTIPAGALIFVSKPTINGAINTCAARRISAATVGVSFVNPTAGGVTPTAAEVYSFGFMAPTA